MIKIRISQYYLEGFRMTISSKSPTTLLGFNVSHVHPSWLPHLEAGLEAMDKTYLKALQSNPTWLPGPQKIFSAFSQPLPAVKVVLLGESPYPRAESANGFAFWDAAVGELWSETGLSKRVNRATSLRNIIKMLLIAGNYLDPARIDQASIAALDKSGLIKTNAELFGNLLKHGFLLLNATPVLQATGRPEVDAKAWQPFLQAILKGLAAENPTATLLLFGRIAQTIDKLLPEKAFKRIVALHPYNLPFITDEKMIKFFKPLQLLQQNP